MKKSLWGEWIPCCFCSSLLTGITQVDFHLPSFQHHLALDTHYSLLNTHRIPGGIPGGTSGKRTHLLMQET